MTVRARLLLAAGTVAIPVLLSPLLLRPLYAIGLVCAVAGVWLASRGVEYPLTLTAIFSILIAFLGRNPFPHGVISEVGFLWVAVALLLLVLRRADALPLRVMMSAPVVLTIATAGWMLARLGASASPAYGSQKLQLFVIENLAFLVAGVAVAERRRSFRTLLVLTFAMAAVSALVLVRDLLNGTAQAVVGGRLSISSDFDPIIFGRDAASAITIAVFFLLVSRRPGLRLASLAAIPVLAVAFTSAGSRGPALGLLVGLLVLLATSLRDRVARRRVLLVACGGLLAAFLVGQLAPGKNVSRTLSFLTGNSADASSNGRSGLWSSAWHLFTAHPLFGVGTGGYRAVEPVYIYPHNLFLETLAELGLVGGLLVAGTIVLGAGRLARVWRAGSSIDRQDASMVGALLAAAFVNAMFSGDVTTNSALWLSVGLAVGLGRRVETAAPRRLLPRRREAPAVRHRAPSRTPQVVPPRILAPAAGSEVEGPVEVRVAPPRTGSPVALVQLEWEQGGERRLVAESDQRAFEVAAGTGAAVVRSRWLAEVVAAALGTTAEPSRRRPWSAPAHYVVWWDAGAAVPGEGALRAVAVDERGRAVESEPVRLHVRPADASTADPAELERRRAAARLEELRAAASARDELAAQLERAEGERDELGSRLAEAAARERELAVEVQAVQQELRVAVARHDELGARLEEAEGERVELGARLAEAASAATARDGLVAQLERVEGERDELGARLAEAAARERELAVEVQAVREELRVAASARDELAARLERADRESTSKLQARQEELRVAASVRDELAARLERVEGERDELGSRMSDVAAREGESTSKLQAVQEKLRVAASVHDELAARLERVEGERDELGSRMSAVAAREGESTSKLQALQEELRVAASARDELAARLERVEGERDELATQTSRAAATRDRALAAELQAVQEELRVAVARHDELAERLRNAELERSELGARMSQAAAAAAQRHRGLAAELQAAREERDRLAAELAGLEEGRAKADPAPPPAREAVEWTAARRPNLRDLELRAADEPDPYRQAELEALAFHLAGYAASDGSLPEQFDDLLAQELGR